MLKNMIDIFYESCIWDAELQISLPKIQFILQLKSDGMKKLVDIFIK